MTSWLWKGKHHAKLIDGFTFTMPDTPRNQARYPQPKTQQPGVGLPIARAVAIVSLATACVMDLAMGPYKGKETGESALLRAMLGKPCRRRRRGDGPLLLLLHDDRAVARARHAHVRSQASLRHADFRRGRRLGKYDHLIVWTRPQRPEWMDEATYDADSPNSWSCARSATTSSSPAAAHGRSTSSPRSTDADEYTKEDIAELYGFRWNSELDIRSIKSDLNLGHVRCKSPEMVHREVWTTLLGYNLIRTTAAGAALLHGKQPRQISFTSTCQYVLASWMQFSCGLIAAIVAGGLFDVDAQADRQLVKSPIAPADWNHASSNAAATVTSSCKSHEPSCAANFANTAHETIYIPTVPFGSGTVFLLGADAKAKRTS